MWKDCWSFVPNLKASPGRPETTLLDSCRVLSTPGCMARVSPQAAPRLDILLESSWPVSFTALQIHGWSLGVGGLPLLLVFSWPDAKLPEGLNPKNECSWDFVSKCFDGGDTVNSRSYSSICYMVLPPRHLSLLDLWNLWNWSIWWEYRL